MKILLLGAGGFLGRRLADALQARGDDVRRAGRSMPLHADLADPSFDWAPLVADVDAVVNAAGVFRARGAASFGAVHAQGPMRLFDACAAAGVARVVQVSALGADDAAETDFLRSKREADRHLLDLAALDATVVQPSLLFGADGASTRRFLMLAALPLLPLPGGGRQAVQPLHVDDAVQALVALLHAPAGAWRGRRVAFVGPAPLSLADYLLSLRAQLKLPGRPVVPLPAPLARIAARIGDRLPNALFDRAALRMLERGSVADASDVARLLGRAPRAAARFVGAAEAPLLRQQAQLDIARPLLRAAIATVWIWTGIVSLWLYPREQSLALLAQAGVPTSFALPALGLAGVLDLLLGVLTLAPLARRARLALWASQAALMLGYSAIITLRLPEWWLHPYGPMVKNLPLLALLWLLWSLDRARD